MTRFRRLIDGLDRAEGRRRPGRFWRLYAGHLTRVFSDITVRDDLLRHCYSSVRGRPEDELFLPEVTTGLPGDLVADETIDPVEFLEARLQEPEDHEPYLILNDMGTGKSTYIHRFFRVECPDRGLDRYVDGIIVDFRQFGMGQDVSFEKFQAYAHDEIDAYLNEHHAKEFDDLDIEKAARLFDREYRPYVGLGKAKAREGQEYFKRFIWDRLEHWISDRPTYNKARVRWLRDQMERRVFLVIDNVDHYGVKSQNKIFGLCTKLAHELGVTPIICLRSETVARAFQHLPLRAYQPRWIHLTPPDLLDVLRRRVEYVFESDAIDRVFEGARNHRIEFVTPAGSRVSLKKDELKAQFESIIESITGNEDILIALRSLTDGNVRELLEILRVAMTSGYLLADHRMDEVSKLDDFIRSIMCGNNPAFFPDDPAARLMNLFDNGTPEQKGNSLVRLRVLQLVRFLGVTVDMGRAVKAVLRLGYPRSVTETAFRELMRWGLLSSPYHDDDRLEIHDSRTVRISPVGNYYLDVLTRNTTYLQELQAATALPEHLSVAIGRQFVSGRDPQLPRDRRIEARFKGVQLFVEYLVDCEDQESAWGDVQEDGLAQRLLGAVGGETRRIQAALLEHRTRLFNALGLSV